MKPTREDVYYEGEPAKSDLLINLLAAITLIGLPFTFAAIVRALWLRYKVTNRRVSVTGGWFGKDQNQVVYSQIKEVRAVPRGFGSYGDMVLLIKDGSKLEMRSVPKFREIESYILQQINISNAKKAKKDGSGFAVQADSKT